MQRSESTIVWPYFLLSLALHGAVVGGWLAWVYWLAPVELPRIGVRSGTGGGGIPGTPGNPGMPVAQALVAAARPPLPTVAPVTVSAAQPQSISLARQTGPRLSPLQLAGLGPPLPIPEFDRSASDSNERGLEIVVAAVKSLDRNERPKEERRPTKPPTAIRLAKAAAKLGTASAKGSGGNRGGGGFGGSGGDRVDLPRQGGFYNPQPVYPPDARAAGLQGTVWLMVSLDASGKVVRVDLDSSSGVSSLDESALRTVRTWKYEPAMRGGVPIPYTFRTFCQFVLQ